MERADLEQLLTVVEKIALDQTNKVHDAWENLLKQGRGSEQDLSVLLDSALANAAAASGEAAAIWYDKHRVLVVENPEPFTRSTTPRTPPREKAAEIAAKAAPLRQQQGEEKKARDVIQHGVKTWGLNSARNTVKNRMKIDPHNGGFARVPRGAKTCAFCTILASRGWVYKSEESAGALFNFHPYCDCLIVPYWGQHPPEIAGYDPDKFYGYYQDAVERLAARREYSPSEKEIAAEMRAVPGVLSDSKKPSRMRVKASKYDKSSDEWLKDLDYWQEQQSKLKSELNGERLYPWEIAFLDRFEALGEHVEWIPKSDDGTPTNDFIWITKNGVQAEVKSSKAAYKTVKRTIQHTVKEGLKKGVAKDTFVIDLGLHRLTGKLRSNLSNYNSSIETGHIKTLYVMHTDGARLEKLF